MEHPDDPQEGSLPRGGTARRAAEETTGEHSGAVRGDEGSGKLELDGLHDFEETSGEISAHADPFGQLSESSGPVDPGGPLHADPLKQYLYDLRQFDELDRDEEQSLAER